MLGFTPMAPGGRWMRPIHDAPPVYIPAKQIEAHYKRLVGDGWTPMEDPRHEGQQAQALVQAEAQAVSSEIAMQARIDQLEALVREQSELVRQLVGQRSNPAEPAPHTDTETLRAQFVKDAAETNDAARVAFGVPAKNTRSRKD